MGLICAIDTETTGLVPRPAEIISIAIVPLDDLCYPHKDIPPFLTKVKPEHHLEMDPGAIAGALRVNGENIEELVATAPERKATVKAFMEWNQKYVIEGQYKKITPLGHNYDGFDKAFLQEWIDPERKMSNAMEIFFDYQSLDSQKTASFYLKRIQVAQILWDRKYAVGQAVAEGETIPPRPEMPFGRVALRTIAKAFNIPMGQIHGAQEDALASAMIYRRFLGLND